MLKPNITLFQFPNLLAFGFTLAFFSGFGQTFLLSLYVPEIAHSFALGNTQLSSLYALATLASAFTLPWIGHYVDLWPLRFFTSGVIVGLSIALLILSLSPHPLVVLVGFWGLRLGGQALMGHTAISTLARAYEQARGKAISLATLGHPAGEAFLPLVIAALILATGWRGALQWSAASLLLFVLPLCLWLLRAAPEAVAYPAGKAWKQAAGRLPFGPTYWKLLGSFSFWAIAPAACLWGAVITAVLFFQLQLGAARGWSTHWVAGSIVAFAIANALAMLGSGFIADRLSGQRVYPFFLLPMLVGLVLLIFIRHPWVYPVVLFFIGLSNGSGSTLLNTALAEVFGTGSIGAVRSLFATALVVSTALGPVAFGALLDLGLSFEWVLGVAAISLVFGTGWSAAMSRVTTT
ncbi:MAG: MFS transporter [Phaeodactylibacter sp.]|nr:MFS transporter [Phaeodactylibacter sp.]MCB9050258.1 MFS transporter [Lewinellaceae bacterium]